MRSDTIALLAAAAAVASASSSSGCGKSAPYKLSKLTQDTLTSDGDKRTFVVNLPTSYDKNTAAPLILSFHGNGRDALNQASTDFLYNATWNANSIVVYPEAENGVCPNTRSLVIIIIMYFDVLTFGRSGKTLLTPTQKWMIYSSHLIFSLISLQHYVLNQTKSTAPESPLVAACATCLLATRLFPLPLRLSLQCPVLSTRHLQTNLSALTAILHMSCPLSNSTV